MPNRPAASPPAWGLNTPLEEQLRNREISRPASAPMTELLLEGADLSPGLRVLDLACGAGTPAIEVAQRVAPGGQVIGLDISQAQLNSATAFARSDGVTNVEFHQGDAVELPFPDASFDRVTSRFGPMFFADLPRAIGEARRVLRPRGRLAWLVWGPVEHQELFAATALVAMRYAGLTELPPEAGQPFRFGPGGMLSSALREAGFGDVKESRRKLPWVWALSPEELTEFWWESPAPPFQPLMDSLSVDDRKAARAETTARFRAASVDGQVRLKAEVILATGRRDTG